MPEMRIAQATRYPILPEGGLQNVAQRQLDPQPALISDNGACMGVSGDGCNGMMGLDVEQD